MLVIVAWFHCTILLRISNCIFAFQCCLLFVAVFLFSSPGNGNAFLPILGGVYLIFGVLWLAMAGVLAFFVYKVHRYYRYVCMECGNGPTFQNRKH